MAILISGILIVASILLQSTILNRFPIWGARMDLVLMTTILLSLLRGARFGAGYGFASGFLQDVLSGQFIGANALTKMSIGYLAGSVQERLFQDNPITPILVVMVGTFVHELLFWSVLGIFGRTIPFTTAFSRLVLPVVMMNSILSPVVFYLLKRFDRFLNKLQS